MRLYSPKSSLGTRETYYQHKPEPICKAILILSDTRLVRITRLHYKCIKQFTQGFSIAYQIPRQWGEPVFVQVGPDFQTIHITVTNDGIMVGTKEKWSRII